MAAGLRTVREAPLKKPMSWLALKSAALLALALTLTIAGAAPVGRVDVRIVTGAEELAAGSVLELRIYEAGKGVRRLPLTHGESWPHDSTRSIPLTLSEPLDPRTVTRFGLYYRAASPLTPPWEVLSAEVDLPSGRATPERLLDASLSGTLSGQGELASEERDAAFLRCATDADCDDHRKCDGQERCAPHSPGADARGCVKGVPLVCPVNQVCTEAHGCRGLDGSPAPQAAAASEPTH